MIDLKRLYDSMPEDLQRKVSCHDLKQTVDKYNGDQPPLGSLLVWNTRPEAPRVLFGSSTVMPGITLYIIELMEGRDDRGNMTGAFISDEMENEGLFQRSLLTWLKWTAEDLMMDFVKGHAGMSHTPETLKAWATDKLKQVKVNVTARDLVRWVESNRHSHEEIRDHNGRLKDTGRWAAFYSAVRGLDSENASLSHGDGSATPETR